MQAYGARLIPQRDPVYDYGPQSKHWNNQPTGRKRKSRRTLRKLARNAAKRFIQRGDWMEPDHLDKD